MRDLNEQRIRIGQRYDGWSSTGRFFTDGTVVKLTGIGDGQEIQVLVRHEDGIGKSWYFAAPKNLWRSRR